MLNLGLRLMSDGIEYTIRRCNEFLGRSMHVKHLVLIIVDINGIAPHLACVHEVYSSAEGVGRRWSWWWGLMCIGRNGMRSVAVHSWRVGRPQLTGCS